jgi:HlyD family secretion protein
MKISALGVEEQRVNVLIDFVEEPPDQLGDGYRVEVRMIVSEAKDVLKVPVGSLFRDGESWAVFTIDGEGRAHVQRVEIGQRNDLEAEITSGLEEGAGVILHPPETIAEGVRVTERPDSQGAVATP